ncbi:MAG: xanthine dehydrogenase family protein molybdopterin-binding subunit [Actinomycetia bacterium]|nr:xanthine dehydrogenase family protein molybdopterin-binding subunit [Actinomycetes bacterium]
MLFGAIKFSEHAHARVKHIDVSRAKALAGVRAVITADDVPEIRIGMLRDNPVLKKDKVRQFRDEVAAVAAIHPDIAAEAVDLIEVEYEPLPGLFTPQDALGEGAVLIHDTDARGRPITSNLVPLRCNHDSGDVAAARSDSSFVVEGDYSVPRIQQASLGTSGCIAELDLNGNLTVTAKTQIPFLAQRDFTRALEALGLRGRNVRVVVPAVGGAFGSGLDTHAYEYIAILLAWRTAKPVRIVYDRAEEFANLSPRQSAEIFIRQGCDETGALTFREVDVVQDNGAYVSWGATYPNVMLPTATSLYRVPNVRFSSQVVYTNNTYCQAMRGYGNPEITWAIESSLDDLAAAASVDPLQMRLLNCNEPGEPTPMGLEINTCGLRQCLETTGRNLDWAQVRGPQRRPRRGVGMSGLINVGGGGKIYRSDGSGIILKLDDFGNVNVAYGGVEMGQGLHSALTLMVADAVGVEPGRVIINQTDTATSPWDVGTHASRGAFMAGNAAVIAAAKLKARILAAAEGVYADEVRRNLAEAGEGDCDYDFASVTADQLELVDGWLYSRDAPDQPWLRVSLERFLRSTHFAEKGGTGTIFTEEAFYEPPTDLPDWDKGYGNMSAAYMFGAQGVEVEVDEDTGEVRILRLVAVTDVGRVISRQALEGQMYGGIVQGVGYALYEEVLSDEGRILNPGFTDYKIPSAADLDFPIDLDWVETNDPAGPFGAKGAGEAGIIATAPAIANAIYDAVGVRIRDLPITPEKMLAALAERDARNGERVPQ